jgi:ankyrin repeat protein
MKLLVRSGAAANAKNHAGRTPLHFAAYTGEVVALRMLKERYNADASAKDSAGIAQIIIFFSDSFYILSFLL